MAPKCSICQHPERTSIDRALIGGEPAARVAALFGVSPDALARHRQNHLPLLLLKARDDADQERAIALHDELTRLFDRVNKLLDACHEWLTDPADESRYTLDPRAEEVSVIYTVPGPRGRPVRKRSKLSRLVAALEGGLGVDIVYGETRHADPRELLIRAASQLGSQLELLIRVRESESFARKLSELDRATADLAGRRSAG